MQLGSVQLAVSQDLRFAVTAFAVIGEVRAEFGAGLVAVPVDGLERDSGIRGRAAFSLRAIPQQRGVAALLLSIGLITTILLISKYLLGPLIALLNDQGKGFAEAFGRTLVAPLAERPDVFQDGINGVDQATQRRLRPFVLVSALAVVGDIGVHALFGYALWCFARALGV